MENLKDIIGRIQKLRSLSVSSNVHEAAAAVAAANKLIAKYQLSEMDLQVHGEKVAESVDLIAEELYSSGRMMQWHHDLARVLCKAYGCSYYIATEIKSDMEVGAKRSTHKCFKMVGRKSDAEVVRYFFSWLQDEIVRLTKLHAYGKGMQYSQNFACGCVQAIDEKLRMEHEVMVAEAKASGQSQAMVLLDNRSKEADLVMRARLNLKKGTQSKLGQDNSAMAHGKSVGASIRLNKGISSNNSVKLLK